MDRWLLRSILCHLHAGVWRHRFSVVVLLHARHRKRLVHLDNEVLFPKIVG